MVWQWQKLPENFQTVDFWKDGKRSDEAAKLMNTDKLFEAEIVGGINSEENLYNGLKKLLSEQFLDLSKWTVSEL
ncbi:hypothetical protein [Lactovum miscens]|uniref:hypothetical protein n=1 Tax=Lactovum miscens TaxID=190387 RepID=UPI0039C9CFB3